MIASGNTISPDGPATPVADAGYGKRPVRVLILGGGFGGVYTAHHLERLTRNDPTIEITLVSRDNYFLMTPLLFEAGSGVLEPRHAVSPIRPLFRKTRFVEADITDIDFAKRIVYGRHASDPEEPDGESIPPYALEYDHLVIALGSMTNRAMIPGSEHALGFKTLADAIYVRNHVIDLFEQADAETEAERRRELLAFVVIGAGLVGVELLGELTEFVDNLLRSYPRLRREEVSYHLIEAAPEILPEMDRELAGYAGAVLRLRGVRIMTETKVTQITPQRVHLPVEDSGAAEVIASRTIVLCAGIAANPLLAGFLLEKNRQGRIMTHGTMRSKSDPRVWALGDCAAIPDADGKIYPPLAQHALREARVLARNLLAAIRGREEEMKPFAYRSLGTLASLGHYAGAGKVLKFKLKGFLAWWVWRTYYVMQMPRAERRVRVILDWTVALLFRNDIVKLDLFGTPLPQERAKDADRLRQATEAR